MVKFKTSVGWIAYKTTTAEIMSIGGFGICDECNEAQLNGGYLVPVLNHWMCQKCFDEWKKTANYYPQDAPIEKKNSEYYEKLIPTVEETEDV